MGRSGDELLDLLLLRADGLVALYPHSGDMVSPYSAPPVQTNLLGQFVPEATGIGVADVNGDGLPDILIADRVGRIWAFHGEVGGSFMLNNKVYAGSHVNFANRLTIAPGDLDGDGDVDLLAGFAEGGLMYLRNPETHLVVTPPVATIPTGETIPFSAAGSSNITWHFTANNSSGTLDAMSGVYTAGARESSIDVIQARGDSGVNGLVYVNVIGSNDISAAGKAMIIAGGKTLSDPVWEASDYLADRAYLTLRHRGFARTNIHYLSFDPDQDVDGNGAMDDIVLPATVSNVSLTITNKLGAPDKLFIYMVDHGVDDGGEGRFRINSSATPFLLASNLNVWLTKLQDDHQTE
ncbi:MAG: FG-GAP-like repeat-containing protein, partial [Verrucomicrobiota bacterium]